MVTRLSSAGPMASASPARDAPMDGVILEARALAIFGCFLRSSDADLEEALR